MALFENDGCTLWFDSWFGKTMTGCCNVHDERFAVGRTVGEFLQANGELFWCGVDKGALVWAGLAFIGVMTGGAPLFFFGRKKERPK